MLLFWFRICNAPTRKVFCVLLGDCFSAPKTVHGICTESAKMVHQISGSVLLISEICAQNSAEKPRFTWI